MALVKAAQLSMNDISAFKGNVKAIPTDVYWDKKADDAYPTWRDNFEAWKKNRRRSALPLPRQHDYVFENWSRLRRDDAGIAQGQIIRSR